MQKRLSVLLFFVLVLGLALAACGGDDNGGDAGDPTQVVKDVFKAIENKEFDKISDYACEGQKEEIAQEFDVSSAIAGEVGADIDPQMVLDAINFKVSGLEVSEVSKSGDEATVHVKADLNFDVDPEKFKDVVRELLKAEGIEDVPDSMLDPIVEEALQEMEMSGQSFDDDFRVVKEGGKWLICDKE